MYPLSSLTIFGSVQWKIFHKIALELYQSWGLYLILKAQDIAMSFLSKHLFHFSARRTFTTFSSFSPLRSLNSQALVNHNNPLLSQSQSQQPSSIMNILLGLTQRRWKSRGNTYQPSTLKRKRRVGFLARAKNKQASKILKSRKEKGRWYLTH